MPLTVFIYGYVIFSAVGFYYIFFLFQIILWLSERVISLFPHHKLIHYQLFCFYFEKPLSFSFPKSTFTHIFVSKFDVSSSVYHLCWSSSINLSFLLLWIVKHPNPHHVLKGHLIVSSLFHTSLLESERDTARHIMNDFLSLSLSFLSLSRAIFRCWHCSNSLFLLNCPFFRFFFLSRQKKNI